MFSISVYTSIKKKFSTIFIVIICFLLAGCSAGSSFEKQQIVFGSFVMDIDVRFLPVNKQQVENKRTKNRIVSSYSFPVPDGSPQLFEKNIIIATLPIEQKDTNIGQFVSVAKQQISRTFVGYKENAFVSREITCGIEKKTVYEHAFSFEQNHLGQSSLYYIRQLYIQDGTNIYILSAASDIQDDTQKFTSYFSTLACSI